jgi:GNAT superfamily N-acetyltransferase
MDVREPVSAEVEALATIWYDGWQDAHAGILPDELRRARTWESFRERLRAHLPDVRVVGEPGTPLGFCMLQSDELYQLFVSEAARGTGVAAALVDDAEARLAAAGFTTGWLACAIGNRRAARFYEKRGWHLARTSTIHLELPHRVFPLDVWRYEKAVIPSAD